MPILSNASAAACQTAAHSSLSGRLAARFAGFVGVTGLALLLSSSPCLAERATLLIPSKPSVESSLPVTSTRALASQEKADATKSDRADKADREAAAKEKSSDKADKKSDSKNGKKQKSGQDKAGGKNAQDAAQGKGDGKEGGGQEAPKAVPAEGTPGEVASAAVPAEPLPELVDAVNASILASIAPQHIKEEVDLLISGMEAARHHGVAMDPPRIFTIYRFDQDQAEPKKPAHREDRLGDIEEIRYLDQKAWGANVGLDRPGLYQFAIETQPWWSTSSAGYAQHLVKAMLPVYGQDWGWHLPLGLAYEIVPMVRPFGLQAPALFTGQVLSQGKPQADQVVSIFRINTENLPIPTPWHEALQVRTDKDGRFSAILNRPGWWCCKATQESAPLKGPDGQPSPLHVSTLFWLFVDAQTQPARSN